MLYHKYALHLSPTNNYIRRGCQVTFPLGGQILVELFYGMWEHATKSLPYSYSNQNLKKRRIRKSDLPSAALIAMWFRPIDTSYRLAFMPRSGLAPHSLIALPNQWLRGRKGARSVLRWRSPNEGCRLSVSCLVWMVVRANCLTKAWELLLLTLLRHMKIFNR